METRLTITARFISDGRSLGYEGERLERYVAEQKEDYEKAKKEEFEREKARFEREERLKAEAKAEEKARFEREKEQFEREDKAKREEHERWKERDAREELKRKEEMELERMKEKSATAAGTATQAEVRPRNVLDKLDKSFQGMKEDDDLMAYLTHFEAVATRCKIDRKEWSLLLSYKLTTFLRNCMLRDSLFLNENYEEVRAVLLRHADINAETCRKRFHRVKPRQNDYRGLVTELRNALDNWLKMAEVGKTVEEVKELLVKDRILENVSGDVYKQLIISKKGTVDDMIDVIEGFKVASAGVSLAKEDKVYVAAACSEPVMNRSPGGKRMEIACFSCGERVPKTYPINSTDREDDCNTVVRAHEQRPSDR
ncbi:uncharacterized protein LOC129926069 [Biomphalaria glabrata]|uniref:Uncharacterized protein LOC129926069 n=1 Tax=Biomphalaria glabrata TaxID=6526 RepID=A0A9W3A9X6_BIOGL|nr:uncharacterized protein LOC129926069 [Biomphalaria glabrata]XP_055883984.1 uncharacterized protein LOC129926069 [Biomphalaria glabrata]